MQSDKIIDLKFIEAHRNSGKWKILKIDEISGAYSRRGLHCLKNLKNFSKNRDAADSGNYKN